MKWASCKQPLRFQLSDTLCSPPPPPWCRAETPGCVTFAVSGSRLSCDSLPARSPSGSVLGRGDGCLRRRAAMPTSDMQPQGLPLETSNEPPRSAVSSEKTKLSPFVLVFQSESLLQLTWCEHVLWVITSGQLRVHQFTPGVIKCRFF